jgi:ABC-2 type transport system permease protein
MRIQALIIRIIRQFFRDKRTLGLIIVAPIFILWLMSLVFSGNQLETKIGIINANDLIIERLTDIEDLSFASFLSESDASAALVEGDLHGYILFSEAGTTITLEGSDPTANKAVMATVNNLFSNTTTQNAPEINFYFGSEDMDTFDSIGPFLIGYFVFFFVFLIAGVSFLRERTSGTLERLLSTPLRRYEIVIGYVLGFGIFTTIQATIIVWFSIHILDIIFAGSIWSVMLVILLLALVALTLGTLLSAYARNELQMIQFIPIVIVPQVFFSGLFNLETMSPWLQSISIIMPLTYGGEALREVMIKGKGLTDISTEILILSSFILLFFTLNILALKKHRKL